MSDGLEHAEQTADALRAQLNELVSTQHRARAEAERLQARLGVPGVDPSLAELSERYAQQGERLVIEVESVRADLRTQEARVEQLRADAAGA